MATNVLDSTKRSRHTAAQIKLAAATVAIALAIGFAAVAGLARDGLSLVDVLGLAGYWVAVSGLLAFMLLAVASSENAHIADTDTTMAVLIAMFMPVLWAVFTVSRLRLNKRRKQLAAEAAERERIERELLEAELQEDAQRQETLRQVQQSVTSNTAGDEGAPVVTDLLDEATLQAVLDREFTAQLTDEQVYALMNMAQKTRDAMDHVTNERTFNRIDKFDKYKPGEIVPGYTNAPGAARQAFLGLYAEGSPDKVRMSVSSLQEMLEHILSQIRDGDNSPNLSHMRRQIRQALDNKLKQLKRRENQMVVDAQYAGELFDRLLAMPQVGAVRNVNRQLGIYVKARLDYEGQTYDLGDWDLVIGGGMNDVEAFRLRGGLALHEGVEPPYINRGQTFCFGSNVGPLRDMLADGRYYEAAVFAISCMCSVNEDAIHLVPETYDTVPNRADRHWLIFAGRYRR